MDVLVSQLSEQDMRQKVTKRDELTSSSIQESPANFVVKF